jgi:hypothetical protein
MEKTQYQLGMIDKSHQRQRIRDAITEISRLLPYAETIRSKILS